MIGWVTCFIDLVINASLVFYLFENSLSLPPIRCQSGASVVEESNALPDYEAAEYNGLRAAAPTGPQVESLCFMTATSAASNESDPEFELVRRFFSSACDPLRQ